MTPHPVGLYQWSRTKPGPAWEMVVPAGIALSMREGR
jgi:hypothetical protein